MTALYLLTLSFGRTYFPRLAPHDRRPMEPQLRTPPRRPGILEKLAEHGLSTQSRVLQRRLTDGPLVRRRHTRKHRPARTSPTLIRPSRPALSPLPSTASSRRRPLAPHPLHPRHRPRPMARAAPDAGARAPRAPGGAPPRAQLGGLHALGRALCAPAGRRARVGRRRAAAHARAREARVVLGLGRRGAVRGDGAGRAAGPRCGWGAGGGVSWGRVRGGAGEADEGGREGRGGRGEEGRVDEEVGG